VLRDIFHQCSILRSVSFCPSPCKASSIQETANPALCRICTRPTLPSPNPSPQFRPIHPPFHIYPHSHSQYPQGLGHCRYLAGRTDSGVKYRIWVSRMGYRGTWWKEVGWLLALGFGVRGSGLRMCLMMVLGVGGWRFGWWFRRGRGRKDGGWAFLLCLFASC